MFKQGPILELSKAAGSVTRVIHLNFHVTNVEQICFIMHRLVFVDAHSVRVCSIPDPKAAEQVSELVWVPLGPQGNSNNGVGKEDNPNAHVMGCNSDGSGGKVISWRSYIEDAMDRPRILWDGSFLWISETHLRKTDDNQLKMPSYLWHWCVVCLAAIVTMSSIFRVSCGNSYHELYLPATSASLVFSFPAFLFRRERDQEGTRIGICFSRD